MKKLRTSILGMWPITADSQVQAAKYGRSHEQKQLDFARIYGSSSAIRSLKAPTVEEATDLAGRFRDFLSKAAETPRTLTLDSLRALPADQVRGVPKLKAMLDDAQPWPLLDMLTGREEGIKPGELLNLAAARGPYTVGKSNLVFNMLQEARRRGLVPVYAPEGASLRLGPGAYMLTDNRPIPWFLKEEANQP